jgi:hypothetical protein
MTHSVPLAKLPPEFRVPDQYKDRFRYDGAKHCLVFNGPMYKLAFDRLRDISEDYDYQRALETLFQLAVPDEAASQPHGHAKLLAVITGCLVTIAAIVVGILLLR